jgi:Ca-activated chloride channel family protein
LTFASPVYLLALLIIPAGVLLHAASIRRRRRFAVRLPATATLAGIVGPRSTWRRRIPPALLALAVVALAVALARPERTVAVPIERASVALVIDGSRSMEATDVDPTRLDAAKSAANRFLDAVPSQLRVGLVGYSDTPHTVQAPSQDREATRLTIGSLEADGGTATGDALNVALQGLLNQKDARGARRPPAAIVLLSDGKTTAGQDPVAVARQAARARIPVYTVALGTPDGVVEGGPFGGTLAVPPDPVTLRRIARASGGQAFKVEDSAELDRVYKKLGSQVGTKREKREVTSGFAGIGLVVLAAGALAAIRWRGRVA